MTKLFSPACERNAGPILNRLAPLMANCKSVLEIGSGTGQHAVYFGVHLPNLIWHCSDVLQNHPSILAWQQEAALPNVEPPLELEVGKSAWPQRTFDAVFTANTCHIMAWHEVEIMVANVASLLPEGGLFCIYGPFNYGGRTTSDGNEQFDASLKSQAPHMGLRDIEKVTDVAAAAGMEVQEDYAMPANNRMIVFKRI